MFAKKTREYPRIKTVEKLLKMKFHNSSTKIQNDAVKLTTEVLGVFIAEAAARSAVQAQSESSDDKGIIPVVTNQHLEKVLPQLLLDF
ncbi:centromere protein X [Parasteatoda tepidariorum]|uniref:centromere protein X n=1 Tax=Parasteatoda tepidariorum TaxID=114398 RepID=UPI001C721128|nr:centromere protein X [Parasteatoda tepidariorum]